MKYLFFIIYLGLMAIPVKAQNRIDYDQMYSKCVEDSGPINNNVVYNCAGITFESSQKEINNLYNEIFSQLSRQSQQDAQKFRIAHQSWYLYREKSCELATRYIGSPMYAFCPMKKNISRVEELRQLAGIH